MIVEKEPDMAHFPPVYSDDESKILIAIYENPDVSYDTYALTQLLTGITAASPDFEAAFKKTLKAIEQLIVRGLVDGKQLKGGLGIYYHELKLKYKGKQEAIRERDRVAEWNKQLPKIIAESNAVVEEMRKAEQKK
jgi:hypothetical protein